MPNGAGTSETFVGTGDGMRDPRVEVIVHERNLVGAWRDRLQARWPRASR
jgi:hypothetical protein